MNFINLIPIIIAVLIFMFKEKSLDYYERVDFNSGVEVNREIRNKKLLVVYGFLVILGISGFIKSII